MNKVIAGIGLIFSIIAVSCSMVLVWLSVFDNRFIEVIFWLFVCCFNLLFVYLNSKEVNNE